ncbi:TPA: mechanosensitive ion channel [Candidatus Woesearchaeota archaeon]|nr:mechanosensitive ion channel [Candidatus Woesearchaeota archaeon]HII88361.1 mechanosensitive ion channel [Candidatus Woesearchaeota archaeon]
MVSLIEKLFILTEENFFSQVYFRIVVPLIIVLLGVIFGRLLGKLVKKILHEIELNAMLRRADITLDFERFFAHSVIYLVYFIALIMALNQLGLFTQFVDILLVAILIVILISLFLALFDSLPNLFGRLSLARRKLFKEGDTIAVSGMMGEMTGRLIARVKKIGLFETRLETRAGDILFIPHRVLVKVQVKKLKS